MTRILTILALLAVTPGAVVLCIALGESPFALLDGVYYQWLIDADGWNPDEIERYGG